MSRTNWDYMSIYVVRATRIDQLARCSVTKSGCTQTETQIESRTEMDDQRDPRRLVSFDRASTHRHFWMKIEYSIRQGLSHFIDDNERVLHLFHAYAPEIIVFQASAYPLLRQLIR